jgi:DNA helicase HerA-like ATPase
MVNSLSEKITEQFYLWEKRGRGWLIAPEPIELEPPFHPFFPVIPTDTYIDDGKRPTLLSRFAGLFKSDTKPLPTYQVPNYSQIELFYDNDDSELYALKVSATKEQVQHILEAEQLLLTLSYTKHPVSFEIVATHSSIQLQFICRSEDLEYVRIQLKAFLPNMQVEQCFAEVLVQDGLEVFVIDFGLKEEFMRPLAETDKLSIDPYVPLMVSMDNLKEGDKAVVQVLFSGSVNTWSGSVIQSVMGGDGKSFFVDAPEMPVLAKAKVSHPLYGVTIRCFSQSSTEQGAANIFAPVSISLMHMSKSNYNSLIPLNGGEYNLEARIEDINSRKSRRMGMLLNSKELLTFVHYPLPSIKSEKFWQNHKKTKAAPENCTGGNYVIGVNEYAEGSYSVSLSSAQRLRHIHVLGATGTGKSTLLKNIISQDIQNGMGTCVIDPHGDLIEGLFEVIPEHREKDVVLIDPSDYEYPVGLNLLKAASEVEKEVLASDLVSVFRRQATTWGDGMNSVLANTILAFLESSRGGSLLDLRRFLIEKEFRDNFLESVSDEHLKYYWKKQFPILKTNSVGPILTRLDSFLRPKTIRNMIAQKKALDFKSLMDSGKIILVKLSQGLIGEENSSMLGSFIVTKLHQAAMSRQQDSEGKRKDFFIYIDEFQNFMTPSISSILAGARKYHLGLVLVHQNIQQLQKGDGEISSSVLSNAGTRICFRLGDSDAKALEKGFSFFEAGDLQKLSTGEAICRIERSDHDFNLKVERTEFQIDTDSLKKERFTELSRNVYATRFTIAENNNADVEEKVDPVVELPVREKKIIKKESSVEPQIISQEKPKEDTQHRYLQTLIKKMAESKGYRATLETSTPDGKGRVDVSIENDIRKIACEISVSTTASWEAHNIEKCLLANYGEVLVCTPHQKQKAKILQKCNEVFSKEQLMKIKVLNPEELFLLLDETIVQPSQIHVKGYRVKVRYDPLTKDEVKQKKQSITKIILRSFKT